MFLPCRYLAMNVYSDFTISSFGRHVTIKEECLKPNPEAVLSVESEAQKLPETSETKMGQF
jgi:hypothetical protein